MEDSILFSKARPADAASIAQAVESLILPIPYYNELAKQHEIPKYNAAQLTQKIENDIYAVMIAWADTEMAGFCISRFDDYTIWLEWFGIAPAFRGRGLASKILQALDGTVAERQCHKIWCDCRTSNTAAIHVLGAAGYTAVTTLKNHWYKQDFIIWEKTLAENPPLK